MILQPIVNRLVEWDELVERASKLQLTDADIAAIEKQLGGNRRLARQNALKAIYDLGYKTGSGSQFAHKEAERILAYAKARGFDKEARDMWIKAKGAGGWD